MSSNDTSSFNAPLLGEAFNGVASAFAPPSAQALSAYARTAEAHQKAKRAAELWPQDPNINQALLDRMNIAAGTYAPNVSYYGVGVRDVTARRGQDIESSDRRFAAAR